MIWWCILLTHAILAKGFASYTPRALPASPSSGWKRCTAPKGLWSGVTSWCVCTLLCSEIVLGCACGFNDTMHPSGCGPVSRLGIPAHGFTLSLALRFIHHCMQGAPGCSHISSFMLLPMLSPPILLLRSRLCIALEGLRVVYTSWYCCFDQFSSLWSGDSFHEIVP